MIVYSGIKAEFMKSVENDTIAIEVQNTIWTKMGKATPENEFRSWDNSLQHMYKVLNDNNIPHNAGIAIEYNIPQTSKRVDFIISGYDEENRDRDPLPRRLLLLVPGYPLSQSRRHHQDPLRQDWD